MNIGEKQAPTSIRRDVIEGLRYVLGHPVLRNISLMMLLVNFVSTTTVAQLVLFTKQRLQASDAQVSLFYSAASIGIVVFSLAAGLLRKRWSFSIVALCALMLYGLMIVVLSLMRWYWIALPIWSLIAGVAMLFNINTASLRQAIVPNHMLGRVISIAAVMAASAQPLGGLIGGFAIQQTRNVALIYGVTGALVFLIAVAFSFTALGHAERYLPQKKAA